MNYAVLLAAGMGTRMKSSAIPKQFIELKGEPILRITVDKFLICPEIDRIVVAAPAIWLSHAKDILRDARFRGVHVCEGGRTRQESLYLAVKYIERAFPVQDDDVVVSHDIARPFVSLRIIQENIAALQRFDAADTVVPATDTIVESSDGAAISSIPDRTRMYQGQTPQTFYRRDYVRIYETLDAGYLERVTDAARILHEKGLRVGLVQGDVFNIKITTEYDLRIASYLLDGSHD